MLILLPPSEGKAAPGRRGRPVDLATLSFPELTSTRLSILQTAVTTADPPGNAALLTGPSAPVASVYTGVLYAALGYPSLSTGAKRRAHASVLVQSALWGPVGLTDRIVPYKLAMNAALPGSAPLAARWRAVLDPVLSARAGSDVVVDCRSASYEAAWRPAGDQARHRVAIRVFTEIAGQRAVVSHWAKHTRGEVVRWLLEAPVKPRTVTGVARVVARHARCELVDLGRTGFALDVLI